MGILARIFPDSAEISFSGGSDGDWARLDPANEVRKAIRVRAWKVALMVVLKEWRFMALGSRGALGNVAWLVSFLSSYNQAGNLQDAVDQQADKDDDDRDVGHQLTSVINNLENSGLNTSLAE